MIEYLKKNHLALLIAVLVTASLFINGASGLLGAIPQDLSTFTNPVTFSNTKSPGGVNIASSTITTLRLNGALTSISSVSVKTLTQGGGVFATTSKGSVTYPASAFDVENLIEHTTTAAVTATLPASTTLSSFVPNSGDMREVALKNIGTTRLTLVGGSGTLLKVSSSTDGLFIDSGDWGILTFIRKSNTDIEAGWRAYHQP